MALLMFYAYPITVMFQSMSVWLLVSITIDRYLAVCHPFVVRSYCTRVRAIITVVIIVIFSVVYNIVRFWEFQIIESNTEDVEKIVQPLLRANREFMLWYQNIATLLSQFVLPLLVLCVLNLQVARTILRATEQRRELVASERREHNTAKMMIFVVIVFLVCYTFSFILNVAEILFSEIFRHPIGYLLNDINNILVVVNSSSPFVFYVKYSTRSVSVYRFPLGSNLEQLVSHGFVSKCAHLSAIKTELVPCVYPFHASQIDKFGNDI
uniref:G_PROTEIN_RECEP_F1_2 domain-containing protein n=1 Tax=Heterorhabditis bacteriophora TaxID=37862 RepID=A0A1I7XM48_HETBA